MKVLFTTTPGRGHIHPMVPLARAFVGRGHDVRWAAAGEACDRIRAEGFDAVPAGLDEQQGLAEAFRRFPEVNSLPPEERPSFLFSKLFGVVRAGPMVADLLPLVRDWRPALLVCDQADLGGPIAAAAVGVPNLTHSFGHLLPAQRLIDAAEVVAPLWEAEGLEPRPYGGTYDHLYLDIYPPSLRAGEAGHVRAIQPLRPVAFATGGDEPLPAWSGPAAADPLVYVTFGTVFNQATSVIRSVVQALRELPVRVLVTMGPGRDPELLGDQPANVHVAGYIRQTDVLPHCAAVASHAGSGTFLAALGHGLPQLLLPQAADQFLNAAAGARAGAGLAVPPGELSVARVRAEAERLLAEPGFRRVAQDLAGEIAAMPPPDSVVEVIERAV